MESIIKIQSPKNFCQKMKEIESQNIELNIIIFNDENLSLINTLNIILQNQKNFLSKQEFSMEPNIYKETKYFFKNECQISHNINLIEINTNKIKEFSFFNFFKKSKTILLLKLKISTIDQSEYNDYILKFLNFFDSNLMYLSEIRLVFDSNSDKNNLDTEELILKKNNQILFFKEYLKTKNFSNCNYIKN